MDVLDLFFKKYSYKFPKGYPDMNNEQDVLLLESILKEIGINLNEAFQDSSNLPDDISNLKQQILDASGELGYEIEAAQKNSPRDYFLYFKGLGQRDREGRKNITQELIDNKILTPTNPNSPINKNPEGAYYTDVIIGEKPYRIFVKGSGGKFDTNTTVKEGLVVLLYNSSIDEPFTKENFQENFNKLKQASFEGISDIKNNLKLYLDIYDENIEAASNSKAAINNLNDPLSSALTIKKAYPDKKIIRDGIFNTLRNIGSQVTGIKADKWNPGDVYLQITEPEVPSIEEVKKDYSKLNGLFVNDWGSTDAPLVSISLKQERAQAGKAKSFLEKFKPSDIEGTQKEYNLTDKELEFTPEQYDNGINVIKEKFKTRFPSDEKALIQYKFDKNPSQPNQLRAKYGAYKALDYLLDNFKQESDTSPVSALTQLAAFGMSVSGVNPTFFKITGNSTGEPTTPSIFPASATSRLTPGTKIIIEDRPTNGEIGISVSIDIMKGDEVINQKKLVVVARNNGGAQGTIDLKPGK
jgi:hypothetical protein